MNNNYYLLRHGEAKSNKEKFISSWPEKVHNPLTKKGGKQIKKVLPKIKKENIDLIFSSDLLRTKQTAEMIAKELELRINFDERLREIDTGIFNGRSEKKWNNFFKNGKARFIKRPTGGENYKDLNEKIKNFIREKEKNHKRKNILIISHGAILLTLKALIQGLTEEEKRKGYVLETGELKKIKYP